MDAILVRCPIVFLQDEPKEKRYLEGGVSVTHFEYFGLDELEEYSVREMITRWLKKS